jgi:Concanavalin A-like lectin/glucanases superfamily/Chitobiase/beta-hexosaminidase C-terminal domain
MHKKIKFIFFVIISLFLSYTVFAQETKVLDGIKDKITIQPNPNSQSGSLTYKDKIGDTSIYVIPQYDKFGGISSSAGLNYNKKFGDNSFYVTPIYDQFGQVSGTAGGTYYEKFGDSLLVVTPQYSKLTGVSTTGSFAIPISDSAALGLLLTSGANKDEILINSGFKIDDKQRIIFSLGQLRQNLDFNFLSGTEKTLVTQNNAGLSYNYFLDKYWINTVEANGYISKTQSRNLTDKNYYVETTSLYELWSDPRRIAGGTVEGVQGKLTFLPTEKTILKVGLGGERLSYDMQTGKDTNSHVTANTEISQKISPTLDLRASIDYTAAENRYAIGLTHNLGMDRKLSLDARAIRGSSFDDKQIFLSYTQAFQSRDQVEDKKEIKTVNVVDSNQIRSDIINNIRPLTSDTQINQLQNKNNKKDFSNTLLSEVVKKPNYFPAQTVAKVDTSAASTRVIKIDKTNIPAGSSINQSSGILTIPIGTSVSSIAGITKNGSAFTNTGQFTLSGNTNLIVDPSLLVQPTTQDTYVVTMNNTTGGGTTLATIKVDHGSTFISSVVISSGSIAPTITFTIPSKTFGDAAFTLSPTSDSPGAFTFTSSNTSVATISGSIVTIVANGTSTITATQASSGGYSSATATATLTVGVAGTVAAPAFSTSAGAIAFPTTITLSSTTVGATIYYTIDGSTPTTGSTQGTSVVVNSAQTIKAFAIKTGYTDSSISSAAYTQAQATAPTFSSAAGNITSGTTVTISSAGADAIYYTIDGSTPTTASTNQATTPLVINSDVTVKALAVRTGYSNSSIVSAVYTSIVKGSVLFSGSNNLSVSNSTELNPGTGDFTIEFWVNLNSTINNGSFYRANNNGVDIFMKSVSGQNRLAVGQAQVATLITDTVTMTTGAWVHVAVVRISGLTKLYKNGVLVGSASDANNYVTDGVNYIGTQGSVRINGYMTNLRVVIGTGVYTGTFTPPTQPLTAITGTKLLLKTSNDANFLKDSSTNNFTITNTGSVTSQSLSPF